MKNHGQATLEFILSIFLLLAHCFFVVQTAFVLSVGSYIQYVTFMASRAYLAAGDTKSDQIERASQVLRESLKKSNQQDRWPTIAQSQGSGNVKGASIGPGPTYQDQERGFSWEEGVTYQFKSPFLVLPIGGLDDFFKTDFVSESWLLRDPSYEECVDFLQGLEIGARFDNGC